MPEGSIAAVAVSFLLGRGDKVSFSRYLPKHQYYHHPANKMFSGVEHHIVLSAILGDGCLIKANKRSYHRITWNMGNELHALHKLSMTQYLGCKYRAMENPGFGSEWHCLQTSCSPVLTMYADKYGDSKGLKEGSGISFELNDFGWAWYYGDDGHLSKTGECFIHTEGKSPIMVREIQDALGEFIGVGKVSVHSYVGGSKKRRMECLRVSKNATVKFHEKIVSHMANGMEYKILPDIRDK